MKTLFINISLFLIIPIHSTFATTWQVGPTHINIVPSAVSGLVAAGDTVNIDAGLYSGDCAAWYANDLYLRGVGGMAHLDANGNNIMGKGIWVCAGNNIHVENIEFSGATVPDMNGAGIRLDGTGLWVSHCYFHDNEDGILGGATGDILVEYSEFDHNGYGDGYSHNIYINHAASFTLRFCYMHHANIGHEVKSRANQNYILYNRIMNEASGNASRELDLPNGGLAIVIGNLFQQGPNGTNGNMLGYGLEGLTNTAPHQLFVVNNTFVDQRHNNGRFLDINTASDLLKTRNNIFAGGPAIVLNGSAILVDTASNLVIADENTAGLANLSSYDYHLVAGSPAINAGTAPGFAGNYVLSPAFQYVHPCASEARSIYTTIDIGAYEFPEAAGINDIHHPADMLIDQGDNLFYDISGRVVSLPYNGIVIYRKGSRAIKTILDLR